MTRHEKLTGSIFHASFRRRPPHGRFRRAAQQPGLPRHRPLRLEPLEDRRLLTAIPEVTLDLDPSTSLPDKFRDVLIGESFDLGITIDNIGATTGFGPYVDLYLPATGMDGTLPGLDSPSSSPPDNRYDGISYATTSNSPPYFGPPSDATYQSPGDVEVQILTFEKGFVEHPFAKDSAGNKVKINLPPGFKNGDQLIVMRPPFGKLTRDQPKIGIVVTVNVSELADVDTPLPIYVVGDFHYGLDAHDNPTTDPSLLAALDDGEVEPNAFVVSKRLVLPPGFTDPLPPDKAGTPDNPTSAFETATGPNFPRH